MTCENCGTQIPDGQPYVSIDRKQERLYGNEAVPDDAVQLAAFCMRHAPSEKQLRAALAGFRT